MTLTSLVSTSATTGLLSLALVLTQLSNAPVAHSHTVNAAQAISRIATEGSKESLGVVSAATDPKLERLLIVKVSARWQDTDAKLRREAAERWYHLWRSAVTNGVVAVIDEATADSLVGYDGAGNATLRRLPADGSRPIPQESVEH